MASQEEKKNARGLFEVALRFEPRDGSEPVETVTTPSMWALADEWADGLRAGSAAHSEAWVSAKMTEAVFLQAAQREGLVRPGPITLVKISEMTNLYEVSEVAAGEVEPEGNAGAPATGA